MFVERTPVSGREIPVIDGMVVGRGHCDVVLVDPEVSRRHALVTEAAGGPTVEDLGSRNGTWVNGHRIGGAHRLRPGDEVRFGNTVWLVREGSPARSDLTTAASIPVETPAV
jgi:pSer/pThr/pTyr-binding forkhead associated (FHA) protein